MKTYTVYRHPVEGMEAVKVGFSWPAFLFSSLWMLDKGLWRLAGGWFAIAAAIAAVLVSLAHVEADTGLTFVCYVLAAGLSCIPGNNGNRWWERDLLKRKYQRMTSVRARTAEDAIAEVAEAADLHARIVRLSLQSSSPTPVEVAANDALPSAPRESAYLGSGKMALICPVPELVK